MESPESLSRDLIEELERLVGERWRLEAFKRFQCVWLSQALHLDPKDIAEALRLSVGTVRRIQAAYRRDGRLAIEGHGNRGGRRHDYLTFKEESAFLASFARQLKNGRIHTISSIKLAYEARVGKKVNKTTIYRLLERHGWGNVATRIHRPAQLPEPARNAG